jgi:hypothetical protein
LKLKRGWNRIYAFNRLGLQKQSNALVRSASDSLKILRYLRSLSMRMQTDAWPRGGDVLACMQIETRS